MDRRNFIKSSAFLTLAAGFANSLPTFGREGELFKISLAEWSLNKNLFGDARQKMGWEKFAIAMRENTIDTLNGEITNLDFPVIARQKFDIGAVEYVNQFFLSEAHNEKYLSELNNRCKQEGVENVLIMVDWEGNLASLNSEERSVSIKNHLKWVDAAAFLGCHSIRVNTYGEGNANELQKTAADSLNRIAEYSAQFNVNVIVENHGGVTSDPMWLNGVMKLADNKRVGTLPDFGNFPNETDKVKAVETLMKYAKGVSAKSGKFDESGNEATMDYWALMKVVLDAGYRGYVGIESGGPTKEMEYENIIKTKNLLIKIRDEYKNKY